MTTESRVDGRDARQLLLWGHEGQDSINNCHVVVLSSDCVASEFLKNGSLHGFANITIVDDAIVNEKDIRNNFLVRREDLGKQRSEAVARMCHELNNSCNIKVINKSPSDLSVFSEISIPTFVVTTGNLKPSFLKNLNDLCRKQNIHQIHIQTVGFFGGIYVDAGLLTIFEGPSQTQTPESEIRAANPFPELVQFFDSLKLDELNELDRSHVPAAAIFYKARQQVADKLHKEASSLRMESIPAIRQQISEIKGPREGRGYAEASSKIYSLISPITPTATLDVFAMLPEIGDVQTPFWQIVRACKTFYDRHGVIPHYGGCPDIETSTAYYQQMRNIYQKKGEADKEEIRSILREQGVTNIDEVILSRLLKNVWRISAINYKPIETYLLQTPKPGANEYAISSVQVCLLALRSFVEKHDRQPNESDNQEIEQIANELSGGNVDQAELSNYLKQLFVSKGEVLPSVVATISAIAAQEVTKIIIQQSQPIKGFFIYNGLTQYGKTLW